MSEDRDRIREALELAGQGRRQLKAQAAWLESQPRRVWELLLAEARGRGVDLPDEALDWPAKRLLRRALGREQESRVRRNPIRVDETFTCANCQHLVPLGGAQVRDHCPRCLYSLHVDRVPGDRAADCGGLLKPMGFELVGGEGVIRYLCQRCEYEHRCRAHPSDDPRALEALSARALPL